MQGKKVHKIYLVATIIQLNQLPNFPTYQPTNLQTDKPTNLQTDKPTNLPTYKPIAMQ